MRGGGVQVSPLCGCGWRRQGLDTFVLRMLSHALALASPRHQVVTHLSCLWGPTGVLVSPPDNTANNGQEDDDYHDGEADD